MINISNFTNIGFNQQLIICDQNKYKNDVLHLVISFFLLHIFMNFIYPKLNKYENVKFKESPEKFCYATFIQILEFLYFAYPFGLLGMMFFK